MWKLTGRDPGVRSSGALNTAHMRGRDGIEVSARTALLFRIENGQITSLRLFDEEDEALEAVGLSE
jgi:ketosteroid isomerase-like protein